MSGLNRSILAMFVLFIVLLLVLWISVEYQKNNPLKYDMDVEHKYMRNKYLRSSRLENMDEVAVDGSAIVDDNTSANGDSVDTQATNSTPYILYYFYSDKCGPCKSFINTWNDLVRTGTNKFPNVSFQAVDVNDVNNENLLFYYNVTKTPTIILSTPDGAVEYDGNRSREDLVRFVLQHMKNNYVSANNTSTNGATNGNGTAQ